MKIICEHCGANINIDRDEICPKCKAPYNKNKEFLKYKEENEKFKKDAIEYKKKIGKSINNYAKTFFIIFAAIAIVSILTFIIIFINTSKAFNNFFKKGTDIINVENNDINKLIDEKSKDLIEKGEKNLNDQNDKNLIELNHKSTKFLKEIKWEGMIIEKPKKGNVFVLFKISIKNNSKETIYLHNDNFICSIKGVKQENITYRLVDYKELPITLESGLIAEGYIAYEVPKDTKSFDITYKDKTITVNVK